LLHRLVPRTGSPGLLTGFVHRVPPLGRLSLTEKSRFVTHQRRVLGFEVIGVVGDDRHAEPTPTFFVPNRQMAAMREVAILARVDGDAASMANHIRGIVRRLDSEMPFYQVRTMNQIVESSVATPRSLAWLLSGFAASGLLLAAIGVFGVLSHAVSQRTREIGVRVAIGASPAQMLRMVIGEGLLQVSLGLLLGLGLALATSQLLSAPIPYVVVAALAAVGSAGGVCRAGPPGHED
jgi:putative ABC transport system permease protein